MNGWLAQLSRRSFQESHPTLRRGSLGGQIVAMMLTAQPWHCYHPTTRPGVTHRFTIGRRSLRQREMRPVFVVVADVLVIRRFRFRSLRTSTWSSRSRRQLPTPLGNAILPRTSEAGLLRLNAEVSHGVDNFAIELRAAIKDQVVWRRVIREGFPQLLNDPGACRMLRYVAMEDTPPVMRNDEEAVEHTEGERRHGEEVHGGDSFTVVAQKGRPALCRLRTPRRFPHPAQGSPFRDFEAKHLQLSMNPRRAPGRVLGYHAKNQFAQFLADAFSSCSVPIPREPRPIQFESRLMPANNGLRLDKDQCPFPSRPEPPQDQPEQFIRSGKPRLGMPLFQHRELLAKSQIFQQQIAARMGRSNEEDEQKPKQA